MVSFHNQKGARAQQPRPGRIRGVVRDEFDHAFPGVAVFIGSGPDHPDIAAGTDENGAFDIGTLLPGEYELIAVPPEGERLSGRVSVYSGKVAFTRIQLTRAAGGRDVAPLDESPGEPAELPYNGAPDASFERPYGSLMPPGAEDRGPGDARGGRRRRS